MKDETVRRLVAMTVASARPSCPVCKGGAEVTAWLSDAAPQLAPALGGCPHCDLGIPIAHLPMRTDIPRSEIA